MADRPRLPTKRFKSSKIRVHTKSARGRTIKRNVAVKISKFSHTPTLSEPRSAVIEDNLEEPSCDPDIEINNEKPSGLSKYHLRRVKEYSSWEAIRESLLQTRVEEEAFSCATVCIECATNIAVCRCVECGPRQFFCHDCAKLVHEKRHYFHVLETYKVFMFFILYKFCFINFALLYIFQYGKNQPARATIIDYVYFNKLNI